MATARSFSRHNKLFSSAASLLPQMQGRGLQNVLLHMSKPMTLQMRCYWKVTTNLPNGNQIPTIQTGVKDK